MDSRLENKRPTIIIIIIYDIKIHCFNEDEEDKKHQISLPNI